MKAPSHMRLKNLGLSLAVIALLLSVENSKAVLTVVDQQNTANTQQLGASYSTGGSLTGSLGQSFTPTLASLNEIDLALQFPNTSQLVQVRLFNGIDLNAAPIAFSLFMTLGQSASPQTSAFTFANPVALVPGNLYSFVLVATTAGISPSYSVAGSGNTYAGGSVVSTSGTLLANDLTFAEGLGVPEPSTWATVSLAGIALGFGLLCRRHA